MQLDLQLKFSPVKGTSYRGSSLWFDKEMEPIQHHKSEYQIASYLTWMSPSVPVLQSKRDPVIRANRGDAVAAS